MRHVDSVFDPKSLSQATNRFTVLAADFQITRLSRRTVFYQAQGGCITGISRDAQTRPRENHPGAHFRRLTKSVPESLPGCAPYCNWNAGSKFHRCDKGFNPVGINWNSRAQVSRQCGQTTQRGKVATGTPIWEMGSNGSGREPVSGNNSGGVNIRSTLGKWY